jgi:ABC-2 type transport system ATP-binding protein
MNGHAVISLDGLSVRLGHRSVLDQLDASLTGRAIGLLGPNGAGKTTLLRTLLSFFPVAAGNAHVLGLDLRSQGREIRDAVGYMPESDAQIDPMTAITFVRYMAELSGLPPRTALERAHEALFFVGLGEARYRKLGTFSTGMRQMAKLAQAVVHGPRLLMLDEPTNGLDPPARKRMLELICEIRNRGETTIVLSSHLLHDVEVVCDEVLILKNGRVAATCNLEAERKANRSFVELELFQASEGFTSRLGELGCEMGMINDHQLKLVLPSGLTVRDIYAAAADHQVAIRHLDCKRNSLHDIFLGAMENDHGGL